MKILITGASGLLGVNLALQLSQHHEVVGVVNQHALPGASFKVVSSDLMQPGEVDRLLADEHPAWVINCAALANLEACEKAPGLARALNSELPGVVANAAKRIGARLTHISTDCVFDGVAGGYAEESPTNPLSLYAATKLEGEKQALQENPGALVARVNFYGFSLNGRRSLAEWFLNNLQAGNHINGFMDVEFSPLLVNDLAEVLIEMQQKQLSGIYHVVSRDSISKYAFGVELARAFGLDETLIRPISWKDAGLSAARSPHLTLSTEKLARDLGHAMPAVRSGLQRFHSLHQEGYARRVQSLGEAPATFPPKSDDTKE